MTPRDRLLLVVIAAALLAVFLEKFAHCDPENCVIGGHRLYPTSSGRP